MLEKRYRASCVILNNKTAWVVGGILAKSSTSTELLSINEGAIKGPDLPFEIWGHCMIKYDENSIYIIGGQQNKSVSNKTWIADSSNGFKIREGPTLNVHRRGHSCGKFEKNGEIVLIVAGGFDQTLQDLDSMEYLIPSTGQGWILGMYTYLCTTVFYDPT